MADIQNIADFIEYNNKELETIKKDAPELHNAMVDVFDSLFKKFAQSTMKKTTASKSSEIDVTALDDTLLVGKKSEEDLALYYIGKAKEEFLHLI